MDSERGAGGQTPSVTQSKALPTKPVSVDAVSTKLTCTFRPAAAMCPTPAPAPIQPSLDPTSPQIPAHPPRTPHRPGPSTCTHRPPGSSLHAHPSRCSSPSEQDLLPPQLPVPPRGSRRAGRRSLWLLQTPAQSRNICKEPCSRGGKQTEGQGEGSLKAATLRCGPSGHRTEASSGPGTQSTLLWKPAECLLDTQRPQCLGNIGLGNHKGLHFPSQTKT